MAISCDFYDNIMDELLCMIVGMNGEWMENSWTTPWEMTNTMDLKQKIYEKKHGKKDNQTSMDSMGAGKSIGNLWEICGTWKWSIYVCEIYGIWDIWNPIGSGTSKSRRGKTVVR